MCLDVSFVSWKKAGNPAATRAATLSASQRVCQPPLATMAACCSAATTNAVILRSPISSARPATARRATTAVDGACFTRTAPHSRPARSATSCRVVAAAAADLEEDVEVIPGFAPDAKLQVKLQSYDHELVDLGAQSFLDALRDTGAHCSKAMMPTRRKIFCVLRSPHVNKDSREHFELRTHQRLITVRSLTPEGVDAFFNVQLPAGVMARVKM